MNRHWGVVVTDRNGRHASWFHPDQTTQSARLVSLMVLRPRLVVSSVNNLGDIQCTYDGEWPDDLTPPYFPGVH